MVTIIVPSGTGAEPQVPGRRSVRDELQGVVDALIAEYRAEVTAGSVIRCVARCTEIATRAGVPRPALAAAVERMARAALDARSGTGLPLPRGPDVDLRNESGPGRAAEQLLATRDEPCASA